MNCEETRGTGVMALVVALESRGEGGGLVVTRFRGVVRGPSDSVGDGRGGSGESRFRDVSGTGGLSPDRVGCA